MAETGQTKPVESICAAFFRLKIRVQSASCASSIDHHNVPVLGAGCAKEGEKKAQGQPSQRGSHPAVLSAWFSQLFLLSPHEKREFFKPVGCSRLLCSKQRKFEARERKIFGRLSVPCGKNQNRTKFQRIFCARKVKHRVCSGLLCFSSSILASAVRRRAVFRRSENGTRCDSLQKALSCRLPQRKLNQRSAN